MGDVWAVRERHYSLRVIFDGRTFAVDMISEQLAKEWLWGIVRGGVITGKSDCRVLDVRYERRAD